MSQEHSFSWRDLFGAVNLHDFAHMIGGELALIVTSARLAFQTLPRLPLGPFLFLGGLGIVIFRLVLLTVVVIAFGSAILVVSVLRTLRRLGRGTSAGGHDE